MAFTFSSHDDDIDNKAYVGAFCGTSRYAGTRGMLSSRFICISLYFYF